MSLRSNLIGTIDLRLSFVNFRGKPLLVQLIFFDCFESQDNALSGSFLLLNRFLLAVNIYHLDLRLLIVYLFFFFTISRTLLRARLAPLLFVYFHSLEEILILLILLF